MTDLQAAWLAGLFVGEGHYSKRGELVIGMTDEDVIRRAHALTEVGTVTGPYQPKNSKAKVYWFWRVYKKKDVLTVCRRIQPWLVGDKLREISRSLP